MQSNKEWSDLERFTKKGCRKPIKHMQLRLPMELYDKIREKAYLQKRSMQAIVLELLRKEFEK